MKRLIYMLNVLLLLIGTSISPLYAIENTTNTYEFNENYLDENGNYENPITGEYFRWDNTSTAAAVASKNFSFKMRYSLRSSDFKMLYDDAYVKVFDVAFVDIDGAIIIQQESQSFSVIIKRGLTSKTANFVCPRTYEQVKYFEDAFTANENYYLLLEVPDKLPDNVYIEGSGSVYHSI